MSTQTGLLPEDIQRGHVQLALVEEPRLTTCQRDRINQTQASIKKRLGSENFFPCTSRPAMPGCSGKGYAVGRERGVCSACINWLKGGA